MATNALDRPLEDSFDDFVSLTAQILSLVLQKAEVALPESHLRGVVAQRALEHFPGLGNFCFLPVCGRVSKLAIVVVCSREVLHQEGHIFSDDWSINGVFFADVLQNLHVVLVCACAIAGLFKNDGQFTRITLTLSI